MTPISKQLRLVAYSRISRLGARESDNASSRAQLKTMEDFAQRSGHTIVATRHDENASGGTMERKGLDEALALIEDGKADGLMVAYLSRFARSLIGGVATVERLTKGIATEDGKKVKRWDGGKAFIACQENITVMPGTSDAQTNFQLNLFLSLGEMQRELFTEQFAGNQSDAIDRGQHIGPVPFGYRWALDGDARTGHLEPREPVIEDGGEVTNEDGYIPHDLHLLLVERLGMSTRHRGPAHDGEAGAVEAAFTIAAEQGMAEAQAFLADLKLTHLVKSSQGKKDQRGGEAELRDRDWTPQRMRDLLTNRTYLGEVRHGELVNPNALGAPKVNLHQDHTHEPLVDARTFALAGEAVKRASARTLSASAEYPLSKICRCASCGEVMTGVVASGGKDKPGRRTYRCSKAPRKVGGPGCSNVARVAAEPLEAYVRQYAIDALRKRNGDDGDVFETLREAEQALAAAQDRLRKWSDDADLEVSDPEAYDRGMTARRAKVDQAQQRLAAAQLDVRSRNRPAIKTMSEAVGAELGEAVRRVVREITVSPAEGAKGFREDRVDVVLY